MRNLRSFSLDGILSSAAKTAALLGNLKGTTGDAQLSDLCLGGLVTASGELDYNHFESTGESLGYADMQGLVAMLDFALGTKPIPSDTPAIRFCMNLVDDLPTRFKAMLESTNESEFATFIEAVVKKLILLSPTNNAILDIVWRCVAKVLALIGESGNDKQMLLISHALIGAIVDTPARLHTAFAAQLLPSATLAVDKLASSEASPTTDNGLNSLFENSAPIAEIYSLVFHILTGFFVLPSADEMNPQAVWDTLLDRERSETSTLPSPPANELSNFCATARTTFSQLSDFFSSDYDVVSPILPILVKCVGLAGSLGAGAVDVCSTMKMFLETVFAEHLEYDAARTELVVVTLEAFGLVSFTHPDLSMNAVTFLIEYVMNPRLYVGNAHVNIAVVRNCSIAMLKKNLLVIKDLSVGKSTLFTFVNALQFSSNPGSAFIHESCIAAISGIIPALAPKHAVEVAIPAITRRIEVGGLEEAQVRGMWESLEVAGMMGSEDMLNEIYPWMSASIVSGDRLKFECSLASKVAFPLALFEKLLITFVERVAKISEIATDKGLLHLAISLKSLCDIPIFHPELNTSPELVLHLRNFWLIVTAFVFAPRGAWPKEWLPVVTSIALKTPTLALGANMRSLEVDLMSNSILRLKIGDQVYTKVRTTLISSLYSRSTSRSESKSLTNATATFLLSILQIELLRSPQGSLAHFLEYLRDGRFYNTDIFPLLYAIGEELLFSYTKARSITKKSVQQSFEALLRCGCDRLPKVRQFAGSACVKLVGAVPGLLWDKELVCFMLDVVLYLDSRRLVLVERMSVLKKKLDFELRFVDTAEQTLAAKDYKNICANLLNLALGHSLTETTLTLQGYMLDLQINFPDLLGERSDVVSLLSQFCSKEEVANDILKSLNTRAKYIGEVQGVVKVLARLGSVGKTASDIFKDEIRGVLTNQGVLAFIKELSPALQRCAAYIVSESKVDEELVHLVCWTPLSVFNLASIETAVPVWNYIMSARPDLNARMLYELVGAWESTIYHKKGLYEVDDMSADPFHSKMTYTPSKKPEEPQEPFLVHSKWIQFLANRFKSTLWCKKEHVKIYAKFTQMAVAKLHLTKVTPGLRKTVFILLDLCLTVTNELENQNDTQWLFSLESLFTLAFKWYGLTPVWSNYKNGESKTMVRVRDAFKAVSIEKANSLLATLPDRVFSHFRPFKKDLVAVKSVLLMLLENELTRYGIWSAVSEKGVDAAAAWKDVNWKAFVKVAWFVDPSVALNLPRRFMGSSDAIEAELAPLILSNALAAVESTNAIKPLLKLNLGRYHNKQRFLLYWSPVSPISAISYLNPQFNHPWILQYAFRVLEYHPVDQVFFYIPQVVQALRHDMAGYVEHFILKTAKISQLFAHQIIWNMKANMFVFVQVKKHEERVDPDPIKPTLDSIIEKIKSSLSGQDLEFYEREFKFFDEVTGISGKLKPFIKRSKAEKKQKIDEEMRKIKVEVGVYLPSNPESIVVDIDVDSGRPLQSHAKAPFMATFKVKDEVEGSGSAWQSAIFKVGDDCRQDVLALQLISIFKNIVEHSGLDVYLYPYRVVATDCGCGVIEVIPHSISRDMMGREKVNSLPNYFSEKYGSSDSFEFKKAQEAFVRSLAAYSVVLYIVSIKDRHNGNIMFDDSGHTVHIDFGFILDIAPGGIEFEASPFKLTTEFVELMGGDASAAYKLFTELVVKTFLALRPFAEEIVQMVALMLDSGLPCFKGEGTVKKLRSKFQLELDDKKAAEFMLQQIVKSHENKFR
ncbi:phosphatidylinositol-4- kinase [Podochytrium sp. JEL0797]|nr:phosphatidylinositol-4- kinase [Podochytrium sp. JEL0797]